MAKYTCNLLQKSFANIDLDTPIVLFGHVKTIRSSKKITFVELNDGTSLKNVQVIFFNQGFNDYPRLTINSGLIIEGYLKLTPSREQPFEIKATKILNHAIASEEYPIQKKDQTLDFLRSVQEYRQNTKLFQSIQIVKNQVIELVFDYFKKNSYQWIHTPILTQNDAEDGGETFSVNNKENNFFFSNTYLTVSGQLNAEALAQSFHKVFTFGPTFRAEQSNTTTHVAEFWMVEPEISFYNMDEMIVEAKNLLSFVSEKLVKDEQILEALHTLSKTNDLNLIDRLKGLSNHNFKTITYREALNILKDNQNQFEEKNFDFGSDLFKEHERYLCKHFNSPIIITNYPFKNSPFYMYDNGDDTSRSFDILLPQVGEVIGGSQREDRYYLLKRRIEEKNNPEQLKWYLNLRQNGFTMSSGYGLGLERFVMYLTGMKNIRDVIFFPRTNKMISF